MTEAFHKAANQYEGCLTIELGQQVISEGWIPLQFRGSNYDIPNSGWMDFLEKLGGEKDIDADFDGEEFIIIHKPSKTEIRDGGATQAFARLWLEVNKRKYAKFYR